MAVKAPTRTLEFTPTPMPVGWSGGRAVYTVFTLKMAEILFHEFRHPIALCIAPPHSAVAETYEQAVHFFSAGSVMESVAKATFDVSVAP